MAPSTGLVATLLIVSLLTVPRHVPVHAWESRFFSKTARPMAVSPLDANPLISEQGYYDIPNNHGDADVPPPPATGLSAGSSYPQYATDTTTNAGEALGRGSFDSKYDNDRYYRYYYGEGAGRGAKKGQRSASGAGLFENGGLYYGSERGQEYGRGDDNGGYNNADGQDRHGEDEKYADRQYPYYQEGDRHQTYVNP